MAARPLSVLLVGCLPPPVGGVSIHLRRLTARLEAEGHRWRLLDDGPVPAILLPLRILGALLAARLRHTDLVHVHSGNWRTRCLVAVLGRALGLRVILTLHSFRPLDNPRTVRLARLALAQATVLVAVSDEVRARCLEHGADPARIHVQYAYLDPPATGSGSLPPAVESFLADHGPVLAASAFRLRFHDGLDLYGLDLLIDLVHALRRSRLGAGLVFVLPETGLPDYLDHCRSRLRELGLQQDFLIVTEPLDFPALLRRCDLLLRPTTTDGDSLSLRESLAVGCRTLASDAVPRPESVEVFRNRDAAHLLERTLAVLERPASAPRGGQDGWPGLLRAYQAALHG
jgi:glycosyltransferase involved in cell wall biosynthesis